jgi:4-aminobutyrate aminotransferase-like enzyme
MVGIEFGPPASSSGRAAWRVLELIRSGLFSQLVVDPLFNRHRILTQVAGDHIEVIKLLPTLVAGEAEVDVFLEALDDVLTRAARVGPAAVRMGRDFVDRGRRSGALHR